MTTKDDPAKFQMSETNVQTSITMSNVEEQIQKEDLMEIVTMHFVPHVPIAREEALHPDRPFVLFVQMMDRYVALAHVHRQRRA